MGKTIFAPKKIMKISVFLNHIKANHKRSWKNDLECRFCDDKILETQEHLEECRGLSWERRNLKMDTEGGKINFFKRVEKKLS